MFLWSLRIGATLNEGSRLENTQTLILVTTTQLAVVYIFEAGTLFSKENRNFGLFWTILTNIVDFFSRIYALFVVLFRGLNKVAVYQNWQISGVHTNTQLFY